ncbi:MAG: Ig-like domain-containing protein [Chloroflexota bacterium]|nr:Ig-like domain-containing protein [Chloroflexota bacterium]
MRCKTLLWGIILSLLSLTLACNTLWPGGAPLPTPRPTKTPPATETPAPPKPVVDYIPVPPETLSPIIVQRNPQRGETLQPSGAIELTFDKAMDQGAVKDAFRIQKAAETPEEVTGELTWVNERTVRFQPQKDLARAATYDVVLTQTASAESGEPLREPYVFRFTTAGYLEVAQVIPAPDTADLETDATITVIFNRPVVPLTSLEQMEELPNPLILDPPVAGEGEWLNTSIYTFMLEEPLAGGAEYTAKIKAGLEDISGAVLADDYVWRFTTLPPKVVWTRPQDGANLVDIETPIHIEFNQPVDPDAAHAAFHLQKTTLLGRQDLPGDLAMQGQMLTFTPTEALDFNTVYAATVDAGVISTSGGVGMRDSFSWRFTTVPLPKIVSTHPANGERDASPHTSFRIKFNTRIDPRTVMPNLSMTPPLSPTQIYTSFHDNTFVLNFGVQPSTDYTVIIDNGIADPYGNTIPRGAKVNFRTAPLPPAYRLRVPSNIATYDAALPAQLVVSHLNISWLDLELYWLPLSVLKSENQLWQDELPAGSERLRSWRRNLESPLNKQAYTVLNLVENAGTLSPGIYLLKADSPEINEENYRARQRHVLVVSELNLTLKTSPEEALLWATDLATGEPVANLDLTFFSPYNGWNEEATTDADGVAQISRARNREQVWAYSETPFTAIAEGWSQGLNPWDFGVSEGVSSQEYRSYITTDRPIYRPGQTINFKGVLRAEEDASYQLPGVNQVQVSIRDATGTEIYQEQLSVSDLGTFHGTTELEAGAALGHYAIVVEFGGHYFEEAFQVAAYRPPEFEVTVKTGEAEIQRGDDLDVTITAAYYFGGPLSDVPVQWNVLAERHTFEPPWGGRYSFSDVTDPYICYRCWWWQPPTPREPILSGSGRTDAEGNLQISLSSDELNEALKDGAAQLTIEAVATGPDNQFIAGRTSAIVHPGPYYVGLQAQKYVGDAGEESAIDLVAVDWAGERLPEKEIRVEVYRREWQNTFIENEFGGGYWDWETEDVFVTETEVRTDELGKTVATFVPPQGGSYHVIATPANPTPETEQIRSSIFLWTAGEESVSWRRESHDRITLISDQPTYAVGETAKILIPSPFTEPHLALVTVERGSIRRHAVIRLETNSTIYRLPITAGDIPNIYVSVVLIQGRTADGPADFKMGLLPLDINTAPKTLALEIEPHTEQAQPGEQVTYTITAKEPDGSPATGAELSLDVVDKAVLSLRPRTTDIRQTLYVRRALNVQTASALNLSANRYMEELAEDLELVEQNRGQDEALHTDFNGRGGGGGEIVGEAMPAAVPTSAPDLEKSGGVAPPAGVEIREEFADTAAWEPVLVTNADGQAQVTVTLPDNLTTWTARAVGLTAETVVGEATRDVVATKPLLVRPVAPRFFVVDDRAQLAANVSNNTDEDLKVSVRLSAEGTTLAEETPGEQSITIPARSEQKVAWWVTVADVEQAQLIFSATSGEYTDASKPRLATGPEGSLLVLRYTAPDIVGTAGQLTEGGAIAEAIALPPDVDTRRGQLTVQLNPSLAAGMRDGLRYLEHFEYECTEQTVSRFLPNLLTYRALQSLNIENPALAERLPGLVKEGLAKLYREQNPDGGWGWWHRTNEWRSNSYISGYVVFALVKARQLDVAVDTNVLAQGISYLKTQLQEVDTYENTRTANHQAWLLYVLAEAGEPPAKIIDNLYEHRDKLSHYARAYLAQSLWLRDTNDARLKTLLSDLNNAAILSATGAHWEEELHDWWAMNTDTRSTAIVLNTLTKLDPDNALNPNVVRWLMVARDAGIWETTQETAWALIALTDWMAETGELDADYDFALYLNDDLLTEAAANRETVQESTTVEVAVADLLVDATNALAVARTAGPGRLYYTAHLEVYRPVESLEPADRGFSIQRRYTDAACAEEQLSQGGRITACPEVREIKLGDVIRVDLTIITPHDRYYVVVEDPLPAGGEAIDTGLATTSLLSMDPTLRRQDSRYWWWWRWYSHSELRDEKVVLFADVLGSGTYEYSYTFRATLPGDYHVLPTVAKEFYFPEVFGRSGGRLLTIGQ